MSDTYIDNILSTLEIAELTPMQQESIQAFRNSKKDLTLLSPTGTGKTLAVLIPLLEKIDSQSEQVQALILSPTRELCIQIGEVAKSMKTEVRAMCCYGGRPTMEEHRTMKQLRPQLIIGTPGRLLDHIRKENFSVYSIRILVMDEFDKCLELGFLDEMEHLVAQIPPMARRIFLSATNVNELSDKTGTFLSRLNSAYLLHYLTSTTGDSPQIENYIVHSPEADKLDTLHWLLGHAKQQAALVFVNYRESVDRVGNFLRKKGYYCETFHGGMEQKQRERALNKFRNGSCNVLVSTDLSARGLDIPQIDTIVHYHLPANQEAYIHRNGRTGRWDATGASYLILNDKEKLPDYVPETSHELVPDDQYKRPIVPEWTTIYIGKGKKDKIHKIDIVGFLCKKGGLKANELGSIEVCEHWAYAAIRRNKLKQLMQQIQGEKIKGIKTLIEPVR